MPEGISENLPPKKPGILQNVPTIVQRVRRQIDDFMLGNPSMPGQISEKRRRSIKAQIKVLPQDEEVLQRKEPEQEVNTLPDLESNIKASEQFIIQLRNPSRYSQDPYQPQYMKSDLGYRVAKPVEKGWFDVGSIVTTAMDRYKLPLAIYIDHNHARLVVKGAYQTPEGRKIKVYNPMSTGFEEISVNATGMLVGVTANALVGGKVDKEEYDIASFLEDPKLREHSDLLKNIKAFNFQKDLQNCIPYCLFVNAMLHGLESGATDFKRQGIKQFEQDFGVRIMTREEMMLQRPRVRIVE